MEGENAIQPAEKPKIFNKDDLLSSLLDLTDFKQAIDPPVQAKTKPPRRVEKSTNTRLDRALAYQGEDSLGMDQYPTAIKEEGEGYDRDNDPFKCVQCPRSFIHSGAYKNHVEAHNKAREASYICDFCDKRYNSFERITTHLYVRHNHGVPHICDICEGKFKSKRSLNKHKQLQHPSPPPSPTFSHGRHGRHGRLITCFVTRDIVEKIRRREVLVMPGGHPHVRPNAGNRSRPANGRPANLGRHTAPMHDFETI